MVKERLLQKVCVRVTAGTPQRISEITINAIAATRFYDKKAMAASFYVPLILPNKKILSYSYILVGCQLIDVIFIQLLRESSALFSE